MYSELLSVFLLVLVVWMILNRETNLKYGEEKQYILKTSGYHEWS